MSKPRGSRELFLESRGIITDFGPKSIAKPKGVATCRDAC